MVGLASVSILQRKQFQAHAAEVACPGHAVQERGQQGSPRLSQPLFFVSLQDLLSVWGPLN